MIYIEKLARIIANQYNIRVVFQAGPPHTDGTTISLPYYSVWTPELEEKIIGILHHEAGHCLFTDFSQLVRIKTKAVHKITNIFEDQRIEILMKEKYPGAVYFINLFNQNIYKDVSIQDWSEAPLLQKVLAGFSFSGLCLDISFLKMPTYWYEFCLKTAKEAKNLTSTEAVVSYAEKIVEKLSELDLDSLNKEDNASPSPNPFPISQKDLDKLKEMLNLVVEENDDSFKSQYATDMEEKILNLFELQEQYSAKSVFSKKKYSIPVTTKFDEEIDYSNYSASPEYAVLLNKVKSYMNPIKDKIERVLSAYEYKKWAGNKKRGRINSRSLAGSEINPAATRLFKTLNIVKTDSVAVSLMVDLSGSMSGQKLKLAKESVLAMALAMDSLHVSFEVLGFNDENSQEVETVASSLPNTDRFNRISTKLNKYVFKKFNSKSLYGIVKMIAHGSNPDGEFVSWAAQRLLQRNEKRKILIVLSDGQPNSPDADSSVLNSDLKRRIKDLELQNVETIGIGIQTDQVKDFYDNYLVINDLASLPTQATSKLVSLLLKGLNL